MSTARTVAQAIRDGSVRLSGIVENPRLESRLLLAHALGVSQNALIRDLSQTVDTGTYEELLARRAGHEPFAFITGRREFWSMDIQVSPTTLIPRPDSETLIEAALAAFDNRDPPRRIIDLGTGTGCLLLALLKEFPAAFGVGLDISIEAAALARQNARSLGLAGRCAFAVSDWAAPINGWFDLIVANPPYIAAADIDLLMPEVARHEPRRALDGGSDGFDAYRAILPAVERHLDLKGVAVLELGFGQSNFVLGLAEEAKLRGALWADLAQIPRAIVLMRPNR